MIYMKFIIVYNEKQNLKIGILKSLYDILKSESMEESIYDKVNEILDEYNLTEPLGIENYIGLDGVYIKTYN